MSFFFVLLFVFYFIRLVFVALCLWTQSRGISTLCCKAWKQKKVNALRHWLSSSAEMSCLSSSKLTLCLLAHCVMRIMISCWKCLVWILIFLSIFTPEYTVVLSHCTVAWYWFYYLQIACLCRCVNRNAWLCNFVFGNCQSGQMVAA